MLTVHFCAYFGYECAQDNSDGMAFTHHGRRLGHDPPTFKFFQISSVHSVRQTLLPPVEEYNDPAGHAIQDFAPVQTGGRIR